MVHLGCSKRRDAAWSLLVVGALGCSDTATHANERETDASLRDATAEASAPEPDATVRMLDASRDAADAAVDRVAPDAERDAGVATTVDAAPTRSLVTGLLRVSSTYFVDTDTRDPASGTAHDDTFADAADIGNPSAVVGHLDPESQDGKDVFRVSLAGGQAVVLDIARDGAGLPDFDLRLYDATETLVADSLGTAPTEMVTAPTSGVYYAEITPFGQNGGIYTLTVGTAYTSALLPGSERLSTFFPMEDGQVLVRGAGKEHRPERLTDVARKKGSRARRAETIRAIKRRRAEGDPSAVPNYLRQIHAPAPDDPLYAAQWHYPLVSLLDAWDHAQGDGVVVAVLDTGIVSSHPDLQNLDASSQLVPGYDMVSDLARARDGDGRDPDPEDPGDLRFPTGSSWHGTHVAGVVAAATNNAIGTAGVAPGAKIMPIRVIGAGGGTDADIVEGILYAAGLPNATGQVPSEPADIITMSFGGPGRSTAVEDAIARARAAGSIVIASSGNENADATFYSPAGEPGVVAVGAVDLSRERAFYSNFGSVLDVMGPGGDESRDDNFDGWPDGILSLVYGSGGQVLYTPYQGTSMAAPHVAGIAALMKSAYPAMTPAEFDELIAGQRPGFAPITEDLGAPGWDADHGHGLLNATLATLAARDAAENPAPPGPVLRVTPRELDFGVMDDQLPLELDNIGVGTLSISNVSSDGAWVTVSPAAPGTNQVSIDRAALPDGVHTATLTFDTTGGTATVRVRVVVGPGLPVGGDVGPVYVLLVDADTKAPRYQTIATADDGYAFAFADVPVGPYRLVAGTDLDADGFIDDEGEVFGGYPVSSMLDVIQVGPGLPELEMSVRVR